MKISIFGLGYVGSVTGASLAELGHTIIGIDKDFVKVDFINNGHAPVSENGLNQLVKKNLLNGKFRATNNINDAISKTSCSIIAVGTPVNKNNDLDLKAVEACIISISNTLKSLQKKKHTIIIRSTVPPGTTNRMLVLSSKISGLKLGENLLGGMNPEFLREGNAVKDFFDPSVIVIGANDKKSFRKIRNIYREVESKIFKVTLNEAEIIKYTNNSFHAMKIAFANEVGRVAREYKIDANKVMEILCQDKKLNVSSAYLKPGFAFGGSCLPKDLKGMCKLAQNKKISIPLIESINHSNRIHIDYIFEKIKTYDVKNITILGLTFKPKTDDLRESPALTLASKLYKLNYQLRIYDHNIKLDSIRGLNKSYADSMLPEWEELLMYDSEQVKENTELYILTYNDENFLEIVNDIDNKIVIKLSDEFFGK